MNSHDYWAKREAEALAHYIRDEQEYDRRIAAIYNSMLDNIQKEIEAFYSRYASAEGISIAEAKKRISKADIAAYERKAARYVKEKNFSKRANEEMRLYNAMMRINRLELLKANIGLELLAGHDELERFMGDILKGRTMDELERQAGILGKTIRDNAKAAAAIVNASFHNATFSDRIWQYQDIMRDDLSKLLQSGLIAGKNPRVLARELRKKFGSSVYNSERLMRTELARVQTEAQRQSFERNGFDMYEFIVNSRCCDVCKALDGKHFKVAEMMPGENAPPVHPHCRCSVAAWEDSEEYEAWMDYLDNGGTTEDWNAHGKAEWKKQNNSLEKSKNDAMIKMDEIAKTSQNSLQYKQFDTGEAANDFFYYDDEERGLLARKNSQHGKWMNGLSDNETASIGDYTGGGYYDLNNYYRKVGDWQNIDAEKEEFLARNIDSAISRYKLKDNIRVQRGVMTDVIDRLAEENDIQTSLSELIGKKYIDKGYSSTTVLHNNRIATAKPVLLDIEVPAGTGRGAYVNQLAGQFQDAEYEFLIKRGASFTIKEVVEEEVMGEYRYCIRMVMDVE